MKNEDTYGLKLETIKKIQTVFSRFPSIHSAILYGSRAKGNYKNGSDIDLTLITKTVTSLHFLWQVSHALDELDLPYHIDLSLQAHLQNEDLLEHIHRIGIVFYQANIIQSK